jgi:putative toxin-antitoxin system antitoxin component (TIGR02293 family)
LAATATPNPANVRRAQQELYAKPPKEHFYAALLGLSTFDAAGLHDRVAAGLSYSALERLRKAVDLPMSQLAELIRVPTRTLARRKDRGRLEPEESDRLLRLSRIVGLALRLFEGDLSETRRWLSARQSALGDESPLAMATTEVGAREVEHLIGRLEHGIPV